MKPSKLIILFSTILFMISCSDKDNPELNNNVNSNSDVIILQERDPKYPLTNYDKYKPQKKETKIIKSQNIDLYAKDFIGHGYKLNEYPFEDVQNLGFPVIDIEKYLLDYPKSLQSVPLKKSLTEINSYSDYYRYEHVLEKTKTVKSGFKIKFSHFSIGSKKSHTTVFKGSDIQEYKRVRGELSVKFYDRSYEFLIPTSEIKNISENYVDKNFLRTLYGNSLNETLNYYGAFVLIKFISGAQAFAFFDAEYKNFNHSEVSSEIKERSLDAEMDASLILSQLKGGNQGTKNMPYTRSNEPQPFRNFQIGRPAGTGISITNEFSKIRFSIRTIGGLPGFSQFTAPKDINSAVYDLTYWSNSLANKEELTMAELPQNSLIPISEFVEEENLKALIYDYYDYGIISMKVHEPCITFRKLVYNDQFAIWETALTNRYQNYIRLKVASILPSESDMYLNEEVKRIKGIFPHLKIVGLPNYYKTKAINGSFETDDDCNEFDFNNMTKFIDSETGKTYLLTTVKLTGNKIAYTYYNEDIINDYTFADIVKNIPLNNSINLKTIRRNYKLIAL